MNIEPTAWKKTRRSFPWQVRVDDAKLLAKPVGADDLRRILALATTKIGLLPPVELTDEQTEKVLELLAAKNAQG